MIKAEISNIFIQNVRVHVCACMCMHVHVGPCMFMFTECVFSYIDKASLFPAILVRCTAVPSSGDFNTIKS